ncbi:MAG: hypothetical protein NTY08_18985 [Proteobacteria bacterium]|nr:hypothetical protein [Pseudomonadota bacterium]
MTLSQEQLLSFLEKQSSFALEMKVARDLRTWGFRVDQNASYEDKRQNKVREFDIRASKSNGCQTIFLGVECTSIDPGLVVYASKRRPDEAGHQVLIGSKAVGMVSDKIACNLLRPGWEISIANLPKNFSVYDAGQLVGRGRDILKQTGKSGSVDRATDRDFYEKISQAEYRRNKRTFPFRFDHVWARI